MGDHDGRDERDENCPVEDTAAISRGAVAKREGDRGKTPGSEQHHDDGRDYTDGPIGEQIRGEDDGPRRSP